MALYSKMVPKPNQNFIENGQQPNGNFYRGGQPDSPKSQQYGFRLDFNASATDRFFFRTSGITFLEYVSDWTYQSPTRSCASIPRTARATSGRTPAPGRARMGTTVLDSSFATNRFNQIDEFRGLKQFTPTDVGLPAYLDEFCSTRGGCTLPVDSASAATRASAAGCRMAIPRRTSRGSRRSRPSRGGTRCTAASTCGARSATAPAAATDRGSSTFDRTYTRQFSDESTLTPSNLGLSLAAFELGLPTSASINDTLPSTLQQLLDGRRSHRTPGVSAASPSTPGFASSTRPASRRRTAT